MKLFNIMDDSYHTLFYAQVMGVFLLIMAIILISRASYYRNILTHVKEGSSITLVAASYGLILGIFLVFTHNIWVLDAEVLVTIVGWIVLIKSLLWLGFPEYMAGITRRMYSGAGYYVIAVITGIIGFLLITHGFYLYA